MNMSAKKRNIIIAAAIAGAVLLIVVIILLARGCAGQEEEPAVFTDTANTTTTATTATVTTGAAVEIVSESVSPGSVNEGDALAFTVTVRGTASQVVLSDELGPASAGGDFTPVFSEQMTEGSTTGDITTWTLSATASKQGRHRFYATATTSGGSKVTAPGEAPTYLVSANAPSAPQNNQTSTLLPLQISDMVVNQGDDYDNSYSLGQNITFTVFTPLWLPVGNETVEVVQPTSVYVEYWLQPNGPKQKVDLTFWKNDQGSSWWHVTIPVSTAGTYQYNATATAADNSQATLGGTPFNMS